MIIFSISILNGQNNNAQIKKKFDKTTNINKKQTKISSLQLDLTKIPIDFKAQNPVELYNILKKKTVEISKDEFETTQQFEERVKLKREKPIIGNLNEDSLFVFKPKFINLDFSTFNYDADNQNIELALATNLEYNLYKSNSDENEAIVLDKIIVKEKKYNGVNAFGVSKEISSIEERIYFLAIENWNEFDKERFIRTDFSDAKRFNNLLKFNFKVEPKTAKLIKENDLYSNINNKDFGSKCQLSSLYIGKIIRPFTSENGHISDKATLSSPYEYTHDYKCLNFHLEEIWIYNKISGEVYVKLKKQL